MSPTPDAAGASGNVAALPDVGSVEHANAVRQEIVRSAHVG